MNSLSIEQRFHSAFVVGEISRHLGTDPPRADESMQILFESDHALVARLHHHLVHFTDVVVLDGGPHRRRYDERLFRQHSSAPDPWNQLLAYDTAQHIAQAKPHR